MKTISLMLILFFLVGQVQARQLAGVEFEEQISIAKVASPLKLNGVGIRYKFFFKIYIAALYVENTSNNPDQIINDKGAKRIHMHFLYDEVVNDNLVIASLDGFKSNLTKQEYMKLKPKIDQFNQVFETVKQGDSILLDFLPGRGTRVTIKNRPGTMIEGSDFSAAVMKIWLGDSPVKQGLKNALLGIEEDY
ncbi:MAG: chalcone isomerase family protein [Gammaproteobacteria bacterium]